MINLIVIILMLLTPIYDVFVMATQPEHSPNIIATTCKRVDKSELGVVLMSNPETANGILMVGVDGEVSIIDENFPVGQTLTRKYTISGVPTDLVLQVDEWDDGSEGGLYRFGITNIGLCPDIGKPSTIPIQVFLPIIQK